MYWPQQMYNRKTFPMISVPFLRAESRSMFYIHGSMKAEFLNAYFRAPTFHIKNTIKFQNAYLEGNREKPVQLCSDSTLCRHKSFLWQN